MRKLLCVCGLVLLNFLNATAQIKEIDNLQKIMPAIHDSLLYNDALNKLSLLFYEVNADSSFYYSVKAWNLAQRQHYLKGLADADNNIGILHELKGNTQQALRYYNDAYNRYRQINSLSNMVQASMNIGLVYNEMSNTSKALNSFGNSFALSKNLQQDSIMSFVYANYVSCFFENMQADSIQLFINRSKEIAEKYNYVRMVLFVKQIEAMVLVSNKKYTQADSLLNYCLKAALANGFYYSVTDILIDLGDITTDSARAFNYYVQSAFICQQRGFRNGVRYAYEKLYDFYEKIGDDKKSLFYAGKLLYFNDDQKNIDNTTGIDYIDYTLKNEALAASVSRTKSQQWLLVCIIICCISSILFATILWRNTQKLKNTLAALKLQFAQSELTTENLDQLNKNYSRLMKVVAHDLRSPISSINMISTMLDLQTMKPLEITEFLNIITRVSQNCFELINQLLHTDIEEDLIIHTKRINIIEVLSQCIYLMNLKAKEKHQYIELYSQQSSIIVSADEEKLIRVINNILANAIKFSPEKTNIKVRIFLKEGNIVVAVSDNGIGIPYELHGKIFDPFTSAKRSGTNGEQAFGLGLYISKRIIEAHGGVIWLESTRGNGTTFYIQFPEDHTYKTNLNLLEAEQLSDK